MNFVNPNYTLSKLVNSPFISMKSYDIIHTIVIFCLTENYAESTFKKKKNWGGGRSP